MMISFPQFLTRTLPLAAALLCLVCAARATQTPAKNPARPAGRGPAATNAAPADLEPPKSVFHVPTSPQDPAKDPFFPQSTRLRKSAVVTTPTTNHTTVFVELELKGISGAVDRRLAIINSRTFGVGEEGDLPAGNGRAHVRVVEIKDDSVVVLVNGEQRILRLRSGI
jgi:hypothetical protein